MFLGLDIVERRLLERYNEWQGELGRDILEGKLDLSSLADLALDQDLNPQHCSGAQERLEHHVSRVATLR